MKTPLKEGEHYMLVDKNIHAFWLYKYGSIGDIKRFGIEDESGENVVEIYLKKFNLYSVPNKTLFKMDGKKQDARRDI